MSDRYDPRRHYTQVRVIPVPVDEGSGRYQATCSCGWTGQILDRKLQADDDADEHVRQATD